jgi:hypothetical protein
LRDDDIARRRKVAKGRKEVAAVDSGASRMKCGRDEKEGGGALYTAAAGEAAAGALDAINAGADGHASMSDETLHCATGKLTRSLASLD